MTPTELSLLLLYSTFRFTAFAHSLTGVAQIPHRFVWSGAPLSGGVSCTKHKNILLVFFPQGYNCELP